MMKQGLLLIVLFFSAVTCLTAQHKTMIYVDFQQVPLFEKEEGDSTLVLSSSSFFSSWKRWLITQMPLPKATFPALHTLTQQSDKPSMPSAYSYHHLPFFCRLEVKLEDAANMPVKFRLGEVQYVERMEGKY